jgi:hypothetical protein
VSELNTHGCRELPLTAESPAVVEHPGDGSKEILMNHWTCLGFDQDNRKAFIDALQMTTKNGDYLKGKLGILQV